MPIFVVSFVQLDDHCLESSDFLDKKYSNGKKALLLFKSKFKNQNPTLLGSLHGVVDKLFSQKISSDTI